MKAAFIEMTGAPDVIQFGDRPEPRPATQQLLIRVGAVAVNPIDTYIRSGLIKLPAPFPYVIGCDFAGTVESLGSDVSRFNVGDRVWGSNQGLMGRQGTFAELIVVDEQWAYPIPKFITEETAAAVSLVGITAHLGLVGRADLKRGETIFVNGGAGGVGSMVVQIAKAIGARVIATAGSDERVAKCLSFGADVAINYQSQNLSEEIRKCAPDGINVYWETRRDADFDFAVPLLAQGGRMILMAGRDARPVFPAGPFYVKDCALHGFAMFNSPPHAQRQAAEDINRLLSEGKIRANIDRVLLLSDAAEAHRLQEENTLGKAGTLAGKIVLRS